MLVIRSKCFCVFMVRLIATCSLVLFECTVVKSQELYKWKSSSGHVTNAAFFKIDEINRKVTLLIPREIDFHKLDEDSIALARKLALDASVKSNGTHAANAESEELRFLREKYDELMRFKNSSSFSEWGFAIGGPFGSWLKDVETAKRSNNFHSEDVAFAVAHLHTLGLEYNDSSGKETEYAMFANESIKGNLNGKSKNEYEQRAMEKIKDLMKGGSEIPDPYQSQSPSNRSTAAIYKYVQDDIYPDVYGFQSILQLQNFLNQEKPNPNLSPREREQFGVELIESKTRVEIIAQFPFGATTIFEVVPTAGRQKGKRLFVISFDVYDSIR